MTMRAAQRASMMIGGGGVARRRQISNCGSWSGLSDGRRLKMEPSEPAETWAPALAVTRENMAKTVVLVVSFDLAQCTANGTSDLRFWLPENSGPNA